MVAINIAYTAPINPPGAEPVLTKAQVWAGLAHKARVPQDFVPVVEACEIHSDTGDAVTCTVTFKSDSNVAHAHAIREVCRLRPPCQLSYEMEDGSTAVNIISWGNEAQDDRDLFLTFLFGWEHPELAAGNAETTEVENRHKQVAITAVLSTIKGMRKLVAEGKI
ncbi:duf1857 domain-containing protein [Thozetella sp. PMI_491]|nr:duf1857 domain-containing protein [Thozetella sp. PMI_491]